jgi:polysaccharide pyruvyl transferase WcaK-like protein
MREVAGKPHFLLVGNGPYTNRGCEAILRGTMAILRHEFGDDFRVSAASFGHPDVIADQATRETDPLITHIALSGPPILRWSRRWWHRQLLRALGRLPEPSRVLDEPARTACCALQIGGDNYSLDYGLPIGFMRIDERLRSHAVPVVLWGASVGPFDAKPRFAAKMFDHLRKMSLIVVRERESYDYLRLHGVNANVRTMSDPAFVMDAAEPRQAEIGCVVPQGAVGLNFSPLMARYATNGNMDEWIERCVAIVNCIRLRTHRDILLIPHVTSAHSNDWALLREVAARSQDARNGRVFCIGDQLSAAETKWVISNCAVFVGARTHSTIAAISSGVPTLSLAYSVKARGLNQAVFGTQQYCIPPEQMSPAAISLQVVALLENSDRVRGHLSDMLPEIRQAAFRGGAMLHQIVEEHGDN